MAYDTPNAITYMPSAAAHCDAYNHYVLLDFSHQPHNSLPGCRTCLLCAAKINDAHPSHTETRYAHRVQTSADPEDPDFGLWTPGSEA